MNMDNIEAAIDAAIDAHDKWCRKNYHALVEMDDDYWDAVNGAWNNCIPEQDRSFADLNDYRNLFPISFDPLSEILELMEKYKEKKQ